MERLPRPSASPTARLLLAIGMFGDGVNLMRENLRRRFPAASEAEIRERLRAWLQDRPLPGEGLAQFRLRTPRT